MDPDHDPELLEVMPEADPEQGEWISRTELIRREGVSERTITTRIKQGYYLSRITPEGKREVFWKFRKQPEGIRKPYGSIPEPYSGTETELPEEHPEDYRNHIPEVPEGTTEVLNNALNMVNAYAQQLIQAGEERGYYKAITDTHSRTEEQLRNEIFRLSAQLKEAEAKIAQLQESPEAAKKPAWKFW